MARRVYNFSAGPGMLPEAVLKKAAEEMLDYQGSGMSVMEMSHRSKGFEAIIQGAEANVRKLMGVSDDYAVLFLQGGASLQFAMVPINLAVAGKPVDYINTGSWPVKAIKEAKIQGKDVRIIASSEDRNFSYITKNFKVDKDAAYLHFTTNNTIEGTQWAEFPDGEGVPLVSDMSSDFMSRPVDVKPFGLIYAGAQKNIGPAGSAMVIIRKDMLERTPEGIPTMMKYTTFSKENSLYNTPSCFVIYAIGLVLKWLEETIGGLGEMEKINKKKGEIIYNYIDNSGFYRGTADKDSRSLMNVTFRLPDENLEKKFIQESVKAGMDGLKGHRSVGGCRASLYNATGIDAIKALVALMAEFEKKEG